MVRKVDAAWLTLTSDAAFRRLEVREIGAASQADQYFSNVLTSPELVVIPLPTGGAIAMCGPGLLGVVRRRSAPRGGISCKPW